MAVDKYELSQMCKNLIKEHKFNQIKKNFGIMKVFEKDRQYKLGIKTPDIKLNREALEKQYKLFMSQDRQQLKDQIETINLAIKPQFVFPAYSHSMLKFDMMICSCTLFDCFYIPLILTFEDRLFTPASKLGLEALTLLIKVAYLVDIMISFKRAFVNPRTGIEERNLKQIAINYLKFFFWIDLVCVLPFSYMRISS